MKTKKEVSDHDLKHWESFLAAWQNYTSAKRDLLVDTESLIELVRQGMINPHQRLATFDIAQHLNAEQLQPLLGTLLAMAGYISSGTAPIGRELVLKLPHDWLMENIEAQAEPLLDDKSDEDYRGLFVLYCQIDQNLSKRLAERALASSNPEIREAGESFMEELDQEPEE